MTMQQFLDAFIFTINDSPFSLFEWIMEGIFMVADCIVSTPLLLFTTGFLFLGGCIGIFGRLLSRN